MWRTLSDDARQSIREMCDTHGSRLYDYCRTELAPAEAEQAVAGAMVSAHLYTARLPDPALRRPWLYALARAHRAVVDRPASIGSWSRPGRMSELLPEALLSLERPHRELLDLSLRHGLSDAEIAAIFGLGPAEVRAIVTRAADGLEEWFAAIIAARTRDGCQDLTTRMAAWVTSPGRRARARISRHIQGCTACRAAPRTMSAGALMHRLPITALPGTLPNRLASAQPLPGEGPLWRADGFPVQARTLVEPESGPPVVEAMPITPVAGPTTATSGKPWSATGAAVADQEHPARGRHPFTTPSRTRPFRGGPHGDKLVFSGNVHSNGNGPQPGTAIIRYGGIGWGGEPAMPDRPQGDTAQWQEFWRNRPDEDDPEAGTPIRAAARAGLILGVGLLVVGLVWAVLNAREHPEAITKASAQTNVLPDQPSRWVAKVTAVAGSDLRSLAKKAELPRPEPPVARLAPTSSWLGSRRTGSFSLSCTGTCAITSATGTNGIVVTGTTFRVKAPRSRPGCPGRPAVRRGRITVAWAGRTTGDGARTGGTTAAHGTLTMKVTWTIARRGGVLMLDEHGVYCG
jgi:DNA-directed RNA polymerase specialized sigma24 family protein